MTNTTYDFIVIDDDPINNMVCKASIKASSGGKVPVCFTNPVEGLKYLENEYITLAGTNPIILFLDINMPQMSGFELLEKYYHFPPEAKKNITIFMLSSSVNPEDIDRARANPDVKEYLYKPLNKEKVLKVLESLSIT